MFLYTKTPYKTRVFPGLALRGVALGGDFGTLFQTLAPLRVGASCVKVAPLNDASGFALRDDQLVDVGCRADVSTLHHEQGQSLHAATE